VTDPSSSHLRAGLFPAKRFRDAGVGVALVLLSLVVPIACRRKEAPGKTEGAAPAAAAKRPGEPTEPSILSAPAPGRPPFAGMSEPRDAALDDQGRLWVTDFGNSRIRIFDANGGYLGGWGNPGNATFALRQPAGVAVRGEDLYIADTWNGRIQYYTVKGEWKATAAGFFGPRGVAAAPDGRVWITDTGNHKVVVFNRSLGEQRAIGKPGPGPGEFSSPVGIAVGPAGEVYVADTGNRRIEVLDKEGGFRKSLPVTAWEGPAEPFLEIGETGEIYVTNPNGNTVLELASGGTVRNTWSSDDSGKPFARPTGIALDGKQGILYVVNSASNGVSKIHLPGGKKP